MIEETLVLFQNIRNPSYDKSLKGYKKVGGFKALKKALFDFESLCSGDGIAADEVGCKYVKGQIVSSDPPVHRVMRKAMLPPLMPKNMSIILRERSNSS